LTAEKFIPNPFQTIPGSRLYKTGDLCRYRADGRIEFLGRLDHQVKINGFRVETGEVEAALAAHQSVRQTVVATRSDERHEARLVAYVTPMDAAAPPTSTELRDFLKKTLPDYMTPSAFVIMEGLPLTPNGKIDRQALPAPEFFHAGVAQDRVAPQTEVEEVLAGIWEEALGVGPVGVRDNFFDLGGHSLLATKVIARVRRAFDVELPLGALFTTPTVEGMGKAMLSLAAAPEEIVVRASLLLMVANLSADETDSWLASREPGMEETSSR
jgi:acyl carrier protein